MCQAIQLPTAMMSEPWFPTWNFRIFQILFDLIPRSRRSYSFFEFLTINPLASTWFYALAFFRFWFKQDDLTLQRRNALVRTLVALAVAVLLTLAPRAWIGWPAPNSYPPYEQMFPPYLRGKGSHNCFPSHSTLVYFMVAMGFWRIDKRWSVAAMVGVLLFISLPRVYLGGHYPVDVAFSCLLALAVFAVFRWIQSNILGRVVIDDAGTAAWNWVLFLWLFELGEGFRGSELIFGAIHRWLLFVGS